MMNILTAGIRLDPEYKQLLRTVEQNFRVNPLPVLEAVFATARQTL
jgi:hypothetical protein